MVNKKTQYTVLIAEDHDGVRKGIRKIIERGESFRVVGEAKDGKQAVELAKRTSPDLLILDVKLPLIRGEEVAKKLSTSNPEIKILALSSFDNPDYVIGMIENGANGYMTKDEAPELLQNAAKDILENHATRWLSQNLMEETGVNFKSQLNTGEITLSRIELQILELLKAGKGEKEIAVKMNFSSDRIRKYIQILLIKYDASSLSELLNRL